MSLSSTTHDPSQSRALVMCGPSVIRTSFHATENRPWEYNKGG